MALTIALGPPNYEYERKIGYNGVFDFEGLYNVMIEWIKARRYWFHETTYKFKPGSGWGKEAEIRWSAEKKISDFWMYQIRVQFHLWDINKVEVIKNGVKKEMTNARMEILFRPIIVFDWQNRFSKGKVTQFLFDFMMKYLIKYKVVENYPDVIYYRVGKFHAVVKEYLDLEANAFEYAGYLGDSV